MSHSTVSLNEELVNSTFGPILGLVLLREDENGRCLPSQLPCRRACSCHEKSRTNGPQVKSSMPQSTPPARSLRAGSHKWYAVRAYYLLRSSRYRSTAGP